MPVCTLQDPALSRPGAQEAAHPSRYGRNTRHMRDRHTHLPWGALREMVQRVAAAGRDAERYARQVAAQQHYVELLPGGWLRPKRRPGEPGVYVGGQGGEEEAAPERTATTAAAQAQRIGMAATSGSVASTGASARPAAAPAKSQAVAEVEAAAPPGGAPAIAGLQAAATATAALMQAAPGAAGAVPAGQRGATGTRTQQPAAAAAGSAGRGRPRLDARATPASASAWETAASRFALFAGLGCLLLYGWVRSFGPAHLLERRRREAGEPP